MAAYITTPSKSPGSTSKGLQILNRHLSRNKIGCLPYTTGYPENLQTPSKPKKVLKTKTKNAQLKHST